MNKTKRARKLNANIVENLICGFYWAMEINYFNGKGLLVRQRDFIFSPKVLSKRFFKSNLKKVKGTTGMFRSIVNLHAVINLQSGSFV